MSMMSMQGQGERMHSTQPTFLATGTWHKHYGHGTTSYETVASRMRVGMRVIASITAQTGTDCPAQTRPSCSIYTKGFTALQQHLPPVPCQIPLSPWGCTKLPTPESSPEWSSRKGHLVVQRFAHHLQINKPLPTLAGDTLYSNGTMRAKCEKAKACQ